MLALLSIFAVSLVLSLALTPLVRSLALRLRLVDKPDGRRKMHDSPVAVAGGLVLFVSMAVALVAVLFGAGLAGASTFNGLKQGLVVGILTGLAMLAIPTQRGTTLIFTLTLTSALLLSIAGGWFGSQLLPPVIKISRSGRRFGPAQA